MGRLLAILATAALIGAIATPSLADDHRRGHHDRDRDSYSNSYSYYGGYAAPRHYKRYRHYRRDRHERRAYRRHQRRNHERRAYRQHRYGYRADPGYAIAGALVGGAIVGQLLAQPRYAPAYATAPVAAVYCRPTTGVGYIGARRAEFGGSRCVDGYGRAYIAAGSQYFIRYID